MRKKGLGVLNTALGRDDILALGRKLCQDMRGSFP